MKNKFYTYFFIICLFIIPKISFGLLSDPLSLDMYKDIDKGIYNLELKYVGQNLKGGDSGGSIKEEFKRRLTDSGIDPKYVDCINGEFSTSNVQDIVNDDKSISILVQKLNTKCFGNDNKSITNDIILQYKEEFTKLYNESVTRAKKTTQELTKIGRIGMYSDGIEENSPFDLMVDLSDIDKIIFESDIPYSGVNAENLGEVSDGVFNGMTPSQAFSMNKYPDNIIFTGAYKITTDNNYSGLDDNNFTPIEKISDGSNQVCKTNNSGLNDNVVNNLIGNSATNSGTGTNNNNSGSSNSGSLNNNSGSLNNSTNSSGGGYSPVNDNDIWPCNSFFCIVIEFVTSNHNLLGGGKTLSIEGLLKKSNEHLKKFAGTSLIQANMTVNIFELGLKDLNLPDIFHLGFQVSHKPVPIINVNKNSTEDKSSDEFKSKNLLVKYYKNLGLEYERANDLQIFNNTLGENKTIIETTGLSNAEFQNKIDVLNKTMEKNRYENDYISDPVVDKKVLNDDMQQFYQSFIELNSFTNAMMEYTKSLGGIIKKMDEIPQK
ncbi:MAG: hypothetical protein PHE25_04845 [Candidatus Gracilibacteria bacterium]|nr:hypothetical protein [Candidatus Gracilibacteria bacterium]